MNKAQHQQKGHKMLKIATAVTAITHLLALLKGKAVKGNHGNRILKFCPMEFVSHSV